MNFIIGQRWEFICVPYHVVVEAIDAKNCRVIQIYTGTIKMGTVLSGPYSDEKTIKSSEPRDMPSNGKIWIYLEGQDKPQE